MSEHAAVGAVLDEFHAAAAAAAEERYLATLADNMVFLGTAPGERWEGRTWREFVHSYFSRAQGWAYEPSGRTIVVAADGRTAWFDETVENAHYGECRGSGVLRDDGSGWKIEQYNLTLPVPDDLAPELVERIREQRSQGTRS